MNQPVIIAQGISKTYRRARVGVQDSSLRETVQTLLTRPWRYLPGLRPQRSDNDIRALLPLSFSVHPGERLGIIGRNGSGKSTLLRILARISPPTEGEVVMQGRVAALLEVGTGFHPDLTGAENIYLNGAILGLKRTYIRERLPEIVAFSELSDFLDLPVKRYSSGMYVRLAFAVAAHVESDILLVDEVLAVGDEGFREKCMAKLEAEVARGRTVIFVSHDTQVVGQFCSRCLVLDHGRLIHDGAVEGGLEHYHRLCHEVPKG